MQPEYHIRKLLEEFVSGRIDHEQFQKEFASVWSAVSESADGEEQFLAHKVQSFLADFVEDLVSEQELKGKLSRIALPTQQPPVVINIEEATFRKEEQDFRWGFQSGSNTREMDWETDSASSETMIYNECY